MKNYTELLLATPSMCQFHDLLIHVLGPLPITQKLNEYILTIQDNFTKHSLAILLPNSLASTIADALVKKFICIFGSARASLTDQGKNFLSNLIQNHAICTGVLPCLTSRNFHARKARFFSPCMMIT